jgi:membrane protease YdiL (CAAX protease family)
LLAGFALAVAMRVEIGGPGVSQSALAGLAFALCLTALSYAVRTAFNFSKRAVHIGLGGGIILCLPALIARVAQPAVAVSPAGFLPWALVVTLVAGAEEYFLRGALYNSATAWVGETAAILIAAAAFAALHVPLYGWHVVPLDFAVGLWLGALRAYAGTPTAPAVAHITADLTAWWLR